MPNFEAPTSPHHFEWSSYNTYQATNLALFYQHTQMWTTFQTLKNQNADNLNIGKYAGCYVY